MAILVKILDQKIASDIPSEVGATNLTAQIPFDYQYQQVKSYAVPATVQDADAATGYLKAIEALKTEVSTDVAADLDDTNDFIVDVILKSDELQNDTVSGSIYQSGTLQIAFDALVRSVRVPSLDPETIKTSQQQVLYWGVQVGTTAPTVKPSESRLGNYGALDVSGSLTGTPQNVVICIPNSISPLRRVLEGAAENIADWVKTDDVFTVGNTTYDAYVKQTAVDNTFTGANLLLVP